MWDIGGVGLSPSKRPTVSRLSLGSSRTMYAHFTDVCRRSGQPARTGHLVCVGEIGIRCESPCCAAGCGWHTRLASQENVLILLG